MIESTEEKIKRLSKQWRESEENNGDISIGIGSEKLRLHKNGIHFHELGYRELELCCIELSKSLLIKGLNTIINQDHKLFWAWAGELNEQQEYLRNNDNLKKLFSTCIRLTLAQRTENIEHNLEQISNETFLILSHISFPLLEGILKMHCHEYVSMSGKVMKKFKIEKKPNPRTYNQGKIISSIEDLIHLLIQKVADKKLKGQIKQILQHIENIQEEEKKGEKIIYDWRNSSLHGNISYQTIGGIILNISILIMLNSMKKDLRKPLTQVKLDMAWRYKHSPIQTHWSFYPPT